LKLIEGLSSDKGQEIQLYQHPFLGRVLVINSEIQHIEAWASLYHEALVHIPIAFIPEVKRVLILGGGSLFAAREILKYDSIEQVTMIDHDYQVIELVRKHYKHAKEVIVDNRLRLIFGDAFTSIEKTTETYDLIINDAVNLFTYSKKLKKKVFELLADKLTGNGVCTDVVYRHIFEKELSMETMEILTKKFHSAFSLIVIPEYPGLLHLLSMWGNTKNISQHLSESRNLIQRTWLKSPQKNPCDFYNPRFMDFYFYLPPYLKKILS
jgi:spermidine synthase